jgi:putative ABC transport system permease protein
MTGWQSAVVMDAWRSLARTPGFTATVVLTLALGIGGTTAIFSAVNQVLLEPLPYAAPEQLVRLYQSPLAGPDEEWYVTGPHYGAYRDRLTSLQHVAASHTYDDEGANLELPGGAERVRLLRVTSNYFDVLASPPAAGRTFTREEEMAPPSAVVLSAATAQRIFGGSAAALGGTVMLNAVPHTVIGVAPAGLVDPIVGAVDAWLALDLQPCCGMESPQNHLLTVLARLQPEVTLGQAAAELAALDVHLTADFPEAANVRARLVALQQAVAGGASRALLVLLGAVGFVLLIVCVNVANLLLARATTRSREFAIRSALGSGRSRLAAQLMAESVGLAVAGGLLGVLLGAHLLDYIIALGGDVVPRLADAQYNMRVLGFAAVVSMGSAVLFGTLPALRVSRVAPDAVLREHGRGASAGRAANRLRSALVAAQVAVAFMLVTGATVLAVSMHRLSSVPLGFETDGILTFEVHLPAALYDAQRRAAFHEELASRLSALPGVGVAGASSRLPGTGEFHTWGTVARSGPLVGSEAAVVAAEQRVVAGRYFAVLGIGLLDGRLFDARDDAGSPARGVISRSAAERLFPGVSPLGHQILTGGQTLEIIGVVEDVVREPGAPPPPTVYHRHAQFAWNRNWPLTHVLRVDGEPAAFAGVVRAELAALDPGLVMHRAQPFADVLGRGVAQRRFTTWIMASFAMTALLLAALGLFGLIAYTVRQRRREIGIRCALGATARSIVTLVVGQGITIALLGVAIGLAGSLALARVLAALTFETSATDPLLLAAAAGTLVAVAAVAALLPAGEAVRIEPRTVLQEE